MPATAVREHGTEDKYVNDACRCDPCRTAASNARRRRKKTTQLYGKLRVPNVGTRRRLEALCRIGYTQDILAGPLGVASKDNVSQILRNPTVLRTTHAKVAVLFEELSAHPGPSNSARIRAERRGWAPPLAWDDIDDPREQPKGVRKPGRKENGNTRGPSVMDGVVDDLAVDLACRGEHVPLSNTERIEALRHLAVTLNDAEIAARLHMTHKAVAKLRSRHCIAPFLPPAVRRVS